MARKYFVTTKQLKYLAKNGYRKQIRQNALNELIRRKARKQNGKNRKRNKRNN